MNIRVSAPNRSQVAFEMTDVDRIEAHNGNEEPDIRLRQPASDKVVITFQDALDSVQRLKDFRYRSLVGFLCRCKSGFVNAI